MWQINPVDAAAVLLFVFGLVLGLAVGSTLGVQYALDNWDWKKGMWWWDDPHNRDWTTGKVTRDLPRRRAEYQEALRRKWAEEDREATKVGEAEN